MALLSAVYLLVKWGGERGMKLQEMMFWRQFVPTGMLFVWLLATCRLDRIKTDRPALHAQRAVVGTANMFFTLGVVTIMPLAEATVLGFTAPIFAVLLSMLFLREKVGVYRWGAVILGLAGVVLIAGPDRGHITPFGLFVGLTAALGVAVVSIQIRQMARTEQPICVVFWFSALGSLMLSPLLLFYSTAHDWRDWALILGLGVSGLFAQLLMTTALRFGSVSSVIVMDYSQLGWATLWGWLIFDQLPPGSTWVGAPLIIAAGLVIARREHVLHRRAAIDPQTAPMAD